MYSYYQLKGGAEAWQAVPLAMRAALIAEKTPAFISALSVDKLADGLLPEEKDKLKYSGDFYLDWDGPDKSYTAGKAVQLLQELEKAGLDLKMVSLFASGGKGFHAEIPVACFIAKVPKGGIAHLPTIYKRMAFNMAVDTLDLRVYTAGRGRMWRTPNVLRPDNRCYKVQISYEELLAITEESYRELTSKPRPLWQPVPAIQTAGLTLLYDKAAQEVASKLSQRKKRTSDFRILKGRQLPSLDALMAGKGIKPDAGFHSLALQLGIVADGLGWDEAKLVQACQGLCESHSGDGTRYNTADKRVAELIRMHRYTAENPCYVFSIGALKSLLVHDAPDLDGIPVDSAEIERGIEEGTKTSQGQGDTQVLATLIDEYGDIASGVDMTKYGVYIDTDNGKKRICAVSFDKVHILRDLVSGQVSCYEADVLVNGCFVHRATLELEIFSGLQAFNRFCSRLAHAMQGNDQHVRGLMLRVAERGVKEGKVMYVAKREGLDVVNIPGHQNELLREPFLIWADSKGVLLDPQVRTTGIAMSFQGYPDPRGTFRCDLSDAPRLLDWFPENREVMRLALHNLFSCQRPDVIGNMLGWYVAAFYRMLFHRAFNKFPLLHVNGAAGAGKTEISLAMLSLYYYNQEPKSLTPLSTLFALQQHMSGSASVPLHIDEYKPHAMPADTHNKLKLLFRDVYNNRDVTRGGGNRDSEDYRSLHTLQLSAPVIFIGEVMEEEPAVMERVVLVTVVRPPSSIALKWSARSNAFRRDRQCLAVLGQYIAAELINEYSVDKLVAEFDPLYAAAKKRYMLTEADAASDASEETLRQKAGAKERTVYNFTVARFGLLKFRDLLAGLYGTQEFAEEFAAMDEAIYSRMADLLPATQAEYLQVLNALASQSYMPPEEPAALVLDRDYALISFNEKDAVEFSMRTCYHRYRINCKYLGYRPLFNGDHAFLHAMRDSAALLAQGPGKSLQVPGGSFIFDLAELRKLGVDEFKS